MNRAAILIGVQQTKSLPKLNAVWDGVKAVEAWARSQGIKLIETITDEPVKKDVPNPVTAQRIIDAVNKFTDLKTVEQLIIYFAGHGINLKRNEYWLLSDAFANSNAAVNVSGSQELAFSGVIPHVVFISDACRTAAQGTQAQAVTGSVIFPNDPVAGQEKYVDLFYATLLGEPSLEIADPNEAVKTFKAVYTEVLVEALSGKSAEITEPDPDTGHQLVRPWPLKKYLAKVLPIRVYQATKGQNPRSQTPDARITSPPDSWLAELDPPKVTFRPGDTQTFALPIPANALNHSVFVEAQQESLGLTTRSILNNQNQDLLSAFSDSSPSLVTDRTDLDLFTSRNRQFQRDALKSAEPFGPRAFETKCGFKIRGANVKDCVVAGATFEIFDQGTIVPVSLPPNQPVASVLLIFANKTGALLSAIHSYLTSLTFDNGQLVDVGYEPSENGPLWDEFQPVATDLRNLRALAAAATRSGNFSLDQEDAAAFAERMHIGKTVDLSLALYAAHPFREQRQRERIVEMSKTIRENLGFGLFDIDLLAGLITKSNESATGTTLYPCLPMLSQSWALMAAREVELPTGLKDIGQHALPDSVWTLFDPDGVNRVSQAIKEGRIQ